MLTPVPTGAPAGKTHRVPPPHTDPPSSICLQEVRVQKEPGHNHRSKPRFYAQVSGCLTWAWPELFWVFALNPPAPTLRKVPAPNPDSPAFSRREHNL